MARELQVRLDSAERSRALADQINSMPNGNGLHAHTDGATLIIEPTNSVVTDLLDGLVWISRRVVELCRRGDRADDFGGATHS
jgi:hypothetical protein